MKKQMKIEMLITQRYTKYIGATILHIMLVPFISVQAAELLTCVHKTGAIVYTRTPEVLDSQFNCAGEDAATARVPSGTEKLDPTPNHSEANEGCPSTATLKIDSSEYSGQFVAELRSGTRPGSKRITGAAIANGRSSTFQNLCPGIYFFAFGPTDFDDVSVTHYFTIMNESGRYNNPTITVFYSRVNSQDASKRVEKSRKHDL